MIAIDVIKRSASCYYATTRDETKTELSNEEMNDYFIADLYGANQNTYGYLACSKSDFGKMVINTFDQTMQKKYNQS